MQLYFKEFASLMLQVAVSSFFLSSIPPAIHFKQMGISMYHFSENCYFKSATNVIILTLTF